MAVQQLYFVVGVVRDDTLANQIFSPAAAPLQVAIGDAVRVRVKIYNSDGTSPNITGLVARAAVKPSAPAGAAASLVVTGAAFDAANGVVDFVLTAAATAVLAVGNYFWDAILIDGSVPANVSRIVVRSAFIVVDSVAS